MADSKSMNSNSMNKDTVGKTFLVAFLLCVVCSVIVSLAAVQLKPAQERNKALDIKRNILSAAGLLKEDTDIEAAFSKIEPRIVELETGMFTDAVDVESFDQRKSSKDSDLSQALTKQEDIAKISRRENFAKIYTVLNDDGEIETIILPIKGYGLWSVLFGFIALEADANTVVGLGYYEHGETAGLGGEVDNPIWKALWRGKKIFNVNGEIEISVIKGAVESADPSAKHKVDGLSGASLTSKGVQNMLHFWMSELGYGKFLSNLQQGEAE